MSDTARYSLRVGAEPHAPATARLFVTAVLRRMGVDDDVVDDVKLAISELVTAAVDSATGVPVELHFFETEPQVFVVAPLTTDELDGLARVILSALFELVSTDTGVGFMVGNPPGDA